MNFDNNTLSTIMQMLLNKNLDTSTQSQNNNINNRDNAVENTKYASIFDMQNGIGDKISFNCEQDKSDRKSNSTQNNQSTNQNTMQSMIEMLGNKNPALSMLSLLNGNKDIGTLAPLLMSMMSNKAQTSSMQNDKSDNKNPISNQANCINKTQSKLFSPIAFAGYNLTSTLCKLYLITR